MPDAADIGLGAIVSLTDNFSGPAGIISFSITKLEERFKIASTVITTGAKQMAVGEELIGTGVIMKKELDEVI
jgi:hypothetical protein